MAASKDMLISRKLRNERKAVVTTTYSCTTNVSAVELFAEAELRESAKPNRNYNKNVAVRINSRN